MTKDDKIALSILAILTVPVIYFALFVPFEGDTGDSMNHYYFARYAFGDARLLLDHWAKPFFTLLASPFAQFGFAGMKLFNGIAGILSAWMAYEIAQKLDLRFPWLAIVFVLFAPDYFVKLFSGYTEPLFGLMLITSIYLVMDKRFYLSTLLLSFLPFVRSEGLIIIVVFAFYFLFAKKLKPIVLLTTGHLVYSIAGFIAGKSLLWVFTEIPYGVNSVYGKGNFSHYPGHLLLSMGVPLFLLCVTGILLICGSIFLKKTGLSSKFRNEIILLLFGSFLAYFLFHTFSWGLGLFGSMGVTRVLCVLIPLQGVISLIGLNFLANRVFTKQAIIMYSVYILFICYILIFPFMHNPASINCEKDLRRTPDMLIMHGIASEIHRSFPDKYLYYSNPYLSYALDINPFDRSKHRCFTDWQLEKSLRPNSLLIWDSWFSVSEERTDSTRLLKDSTLKLIRRYPDPEHKSASEFILFKHQ